MKAYKIYLTKSCEVASLLAASYQLEMKKSDSGITRVSHGPADDEESVPAIYYDEKYFRCTVERESDTPSYELIIA